MLVGHLGAGLAAKAVEPRLNLGTLFAAALFLDIIFWSLLLAGIEAAHVPADFASRHYLTFTFPYSHSLVGAVLLSLLFALAWAAWRARDKAGERILLSGAVIVALTVFSHWVLDWLVHVPEMPLAPGGAATGLGLWQHQPAAIILELLLAAIALAAFLARARMSPWRKLAVCAVTVLLGGLTAMGAFAATPPPAADIFAASSLGLIALAVGVAAWADARLRSAGI